VEPVQEELNDRVAMMLGRAIIRAEALDIELAKFQTELENIKQLIPAQEDEEKT
jgi:hypothetical protein